MIFPVLLRENFKTLLKMSENQQKKGWWTKYSESRLIEVENKILSVVRTAFKTWFVPIGSTVGENDKIWTISLNEDSSKTPLVMLHGFAAGIGFWCKNFDDIAKDRPVYAIDLLGFGRSSRPTFGKECETAEQQWVTAIEAWRKEVNLDKFILLGHSFGGYLATSYTINHPERVKHLILADPWGFSEKSANFKPSIWLRLLGVVLYPLTYFNPLSTVRAVGPFGPWLVKKTRSDIARKYGDILNDDEVIVEYIYHCNSQYPSGETAFHSFLRGFGWARNPMIERYDQIHLTVPITVVFGEKSWITKEPGYILQEKRENKSYVDIQIVQDAGHHLYSDQPRIFNQVVRDTCRLADSFKDCNDLLQSKKLKTIEKFDQAEVKTVCEDKARGDEINEDEIMELAEESNKSEITAK